MKRIVSTAEFDAFENDLKDLVGRAKIQARIKRMADGNAGDHRNLQKGVVELKLNYGPGYRVYCTVRDSNTLLVLLIGGDKSTQRNDIAAAYRMVDAL